VLFYVMHNQLLSYGPCTSEKRCTLCATLDRDQSDVGSIAFNAYMILQHSLYTKHFRTTS